MDGLATFGYPRPDVADGCEGFVRPSIRQDLQDALGVDQAVALGLDLQDAGDQVLFAWGPYPVAHAEVPSQILKIGQASVLQIGQVECHILFHWIMFTSHGKAATGRVVPGCADG